MSFDDCTIFKHAVQALNILYAANFNHSLRIVDNCIEIAQKVVA